MRSTFSGLELAKRALFTQQAALTTTGHNIANANTAGYSRQVVNMVASNPIEVPGLMRSTVPGQMGQGVEFDHITRIRQQFLDDQFHNENKSMGEWEVRKDTLDKLQSITNEPSDTGIRTTVENFWNAWQELSKTPENTTARVLVKENALAMTDALNSIGKKLDDLSNDLTNNIDVNIKQSNSYLTQIASLNNEIVRVEGLGDSANDLRDQRDLLVDNLSKIMNISTTEIASGYSIKMGNVQLVQGPTVSTVLTPALLNTSYTSRDLSSGSIYGMISSRDINVANFKLQLDNMMNVLATGDIKVTLPKGMVVPDGTTINGVKYTGNITNRTLSGDTPTTVKGLNGLHALGYSGVDGALKSGIPFFTLKPGFTTFNSNSVTVNPDIVNNVANISTSTRTFVDSTTGIEKVVKGNNDMALLVAGVRAQKIKFDANATLKLSFADGTFDEYYHSLIGELGVQSQVATQQATNQKTLLDQVESSRQSVSGVSLDEEMANMIKFQHSYNAAARAMTTYDQCLDKVINSMGIVGR